jgi:hypothetical protein
MRSLKPYLLALGGFMAAVLGAFFSGVPSAAATAPVSGTNPDLQSKQAATSAEVVAHRDAKPAGKTPVPDAHTPVRDACSEPLRPVDAWTLCPQPMAAERIVDVRELLLVGVIELRI